MANAIVGNVLIIDSLGLANTPGGGSAEVTAISFYGSNSTSKMELMMYPETAVVVVMMQSPINQPNVTTLRFGNPVEFEKFRVKTLTAGSGFVYFV